MRIPIATMVGANLHGGLVLGAFRPDGEAVAMSFAFLGRRRHGEEPVKGPEEGGQRLARTRRRQDQRVLPLADGPPPLLLSGCGGREGGGEPPAGRR